MEHLREQFINLPLTQLRAFNQLIEVLQYLENQHQTLSLSNRKKLMLIIQQIQQNLKQDFEKYFKYSEDQRIQYHPEDKLIPDLWFRKQIEKNTQQLIEQTNFIYEHYLNSFTDHQTFIDQKFTRIQDFKIVLEPHKVKKPPLDK